MTISQIRMTRKRMKTIQKGRTTILMASRTRTVRERIFAIRDAVNKFYLYACHCRSPQVRCVGVVQGPRFLPAGFVAATTTSSYGVRASQQRYSDYKVVVADEWESAEDWKAPVELPVRPQLKCCSRFIHFSSISTPGCAYMSAIENCISWSDRCCCLPVSLLDVCRTLHGRVSQLNWTSSRLTIALS